MGGVWAARMLMGRKGKGGRGGSKLPQGMELVPCNKSILPLFSGHGMLRNRVVQCSAEDGSIPVASSNTPLGNLAWIGETNGRIRKGGTPRIRTLNHRQVDATFIGCILKSDQRLGHSYAEQLPPSLGESLNPKSKREVPLVAENHFNITQMGRRKGREKPKWHQL